MASLEELQGLYRHIQAAQLYAANIGEPNVAILLDKMLDVVYERAKGLIDEPGREARRKRAEERQLQIEAWEGEGGATQ